MVIFGDHSRVVGVLKWPVFRPRLVQTLIQRPLLRDTRAGTDFLLDARALGTAANKLSRSR